MWKQTIMCSWKQRNRELKIRCLFQCQESCIVPRERAPGVSVKPFKPWEQEVAWECKISFTLYCQGTGVNCAMDKVFLLNEAVVIAVCWAPDLGIGHSSLLWVPRFRERYARSVCPGSHPPAPRSSLLGFKFRSCQTLENMFLSSKNVWSST